MSGRLFMDEVRRSGAELLPIERANVEKLFADLAQAGVLVPAAERIGQEAVTAALLGRLTSPYPGAATPPEKPVLLLTDSPAAREQAGALATSLRLGLADLPDEVRQTLDTADLTSRIEGYHTERETHRLRAAFVEARSNASRTAEQRLGRR